MSMPFRVQRGIVIETAENNRQAITSTDQIINGSSNVGLVDLSTIWNTSGNVTAIGLNVTNTSSGSRSALMDLRVNDSSRFYVSKDGNVGIGTSVPTYKLDVIGTTSTTVGYLTNGSSMSPVYGFNGNAAAGMSLWYGKLILQSGGLSGTDVGIALNTSSGYSYDSANDRLVVLGNGNIGIGTSSPTGRLHVVSNGIGNVSTDGFVLENNTDATAGLQQWSPRIRLSSEGWRSNAPTISNKLDWIIENRATAGNNSGTGTIAMSYQTSNVPGYKTKFSITPGDTDGGSTSVYIDASSGQSTLYIRGSGETNGLVMGSNAGAAKFIQSYESQPLIINGAGNNVGIGVTPSYPLDTGTNTARIGGLVFTYNNGGSPYYASTVSTPYANKLVFTSTHIMAGYGVWLRGNDESQVGFDSNGNKELIMYANTYEVARFDNFARLGIATSTPGSRLDVNGNASFRSAISVAGTANVNSLTSNTGIYVGAGGITVNGLSTINGNLSVTGNINVTGTINTQSANVIVVEDPIIYIGEDNPANLWDMGLVASYNSGTYYHTGLVRNKDDGAWTLFDTLPSEPNLITGHIEWSNAFITYALFKAGNVNVVGNTKSTSTSTGAIVLNGTGGIGVGGNINVGGAHSTMAGALTVGTNTPGSVAFTVSGSSPVAMDLRTGNFGWWRIESSSSSNAGTLQIASQNSSYTPFLANGVNNTLTLQGNVGVGITSPTSRVEILTGIGVAGPGGGNNLTLRHSATNGNTMLMNLGVSTVGKGGLNQGHAYIQAAYWGGSNDNPLVLQPLDGGVIVGDNLSHDWRLTVRGTTAIASNMNVHQAYGGRLAFPAQGYSGEMAWISSVFDGAGGFAGGAGLAFGTISGGDVAGSDGIERLRIRANGNIGVGTTLPLSTFDVASGQLLIPAGSVTTPGLAFRTSTGTGLYMTSTTADGLYVSHNGNVVINFRDGGNYSNEHFVPNGDNTLTLGSFNNRWSNVYATYFAPRIGSAATPSYRFDDGAANPINAGMFGVGNATVNQLGFSTMGTERIRIDSSGLVGIGTVTPTERLHVFSSSNTFLKAQSTTVAAAGLWLENSTGWYKWQMDSTRALSLTDSAGPNRLFLANNGNFGVGDFAVSTPGATYAPKAKFDIAGSLAVGYAITDTFTAPTNGAVINGSVGIGTMSPTSKLHVYSDSASDKVVINLGGYSTGPNTAGFNVWMNTYAATPTVAQFGFSNGAGSRMGGFAFSDISGTSDWAVPRMDMTQSYGGASEIRSLIAGQDASWAGMKFTVQTTSDTALTTSPTFIWNNYNTELMRIDKSGNVGIGVTNPLSKLSVNIDAAINNSGAWYTAGQVGGVLYLGNEIGAPTAIESFTPSDRSTATELGLRFKYVTTAGTQAIAMTISSAGSVGIGTTSPAAKLHVLTTSGSQSRFAYDANNYTDVNYNGFNTVGGAQLFSLAGTVRMRVSTVAVGIGTTAEPSGPTASLVIRGTGTSGAGIQLANVNVAGANIGIGGSNSLVFSTYTGAIGSETYTERMRMDAGGNLSIGATSAFGSGQRVVEIVGTGGGISDYGSLSLRNSSDSGNNFAGSIDFRAGVTTYGAIRTLLSAGGAGGSGQLKFYTLNAGVFSSRATLDENGQFSSNSVLVGGGAYGAEHDGIILRANNTGAGANERIVFWDYANNPISSIKNIYPGGTNVGSLAFSTNNGSGITERMRITNSGNVGIGVTTPIALLEVRGTSLSPDAYIAVTTPAGGGGARKPALLLKDEYYLSQGGLTGSYVASVRAGLDLELASSSTDTYQLRAKLLIGGGTEKDFRFYSSNDKGANYTELARIDNSGNFGLGAVPNTWDIAAGRVMQMPSASIANYDNLSGNYQLWLFNNAYRDNTGTFRYVKASTAAYYSMNNVGGHVWFVAPSGGAGNAVTFTQAMTMDNNGNVGIGMTSPTARLEVTYSTGTLATTIARFNGASGRFVRIIDNDGSGGAGVETTNVYGASGSSGTLKLNNTFGNANRSQIVLDTAYMSISTPGASVSTERLRINNAGNVLIGTADSPLGGTATLVLRGVGTNGSGIEFSNVNVAGANIGIGGSNSLVFSTYTGAIGSETYIERMRMDSDGDLGIGTSVISSGTRLMVVGGNISLNPTGSATGYGIVFPDGTFQTTAAVGGGGSSFGDAGTVQYSGGAGTFAGDAANFFWDSANSRLGIGTGSPTNTLSVWGSTPAYFRTTNGSDIYEVVIGNTTSTSTTIGYSSASSPVPFGYISATASAAKNITFNSAGKTGIGGTTQPKNTLDIAGATVIGATYAGNANYMPPANSLAVQNRLGIGTSNPTGTLDVRGTAYFNYNGVDNTGLTTIDVLSNASRIIQYTTSGNVTNLFNANGNSWINGGNLGIGTATPDEPITIYRGVANTRVGLDDRGIYFSRPSDGGYSGGVYTSTGFGSGQTIVLDNREGVYLQYNTATKLTVGNNGIRIGNGNTASTNMLDVAGATTISNLSITNTTISTSTTTGALLMGGGAGIGGNVNIGGYLQIPQMRMYSFTRTIPTVVNDTVDLGSATLSQGGGMFEISIVSPNSSFSVSKHYLLPINYGETGSNWTIAQPISDGGPYGGNDFDLDINVATNVTSFRIRRTAGSTAGTAYITIKQIGVSLAFVESTATASVAAPDTLYNASVLRQVDGKVGIGTTSPTSPLEIVGGTVAGATTYHLKIKNYDGQAASIGTQGSSWGVLGLWAPGASGTPTLGLNISTINVSQPISEYSTSIRLNPRGDIGALPGVIITSGGASVKTFVVKGATSQSAALTEWHDSNGTVMVQVSASGSIGIGTFTPGSRLDVNGNASFRNDISVAGTARVGVLVSNGAISGTTGTFSGNVNISGNLNVTGTINTQNANVIVVEDPIIYIGEDNPADLWDMGLVASYNNGTYYHTGLVRNKNDGAWTLFDTLPSEPNVITGQIEWSNASITYGLFKAGNVNIVGNTKSTSTSTGAIVLNGTGGIGVGGNVYTGGNVVAASFQPTSASVPPSGLYLPAANTLAFSTNNLERMRVTSAGSVGIGTNAPSRKLHVEGDVLIGSEVDNIFSSLKVRMHRDGGYATEIYKVGGGSGGSVLYLESQSGTGQYMIRAYTGLLGEVFSIKENGTGYVYGNLGVGTASPATRLHITGDMSLRSNIGNGDHDIVFGTTQVWNNSIAARIKGTLEGSSAGYALGSLRFHTAGGTADADIERMRINQVGNVGIGTSTVTAKFEVYDAVNPIIKINNGVYSASLYQGSSYDTTLAMSSQGIIKWGSTASLSLLGTSATTSWIIQDNGFYNNSNSSYIRVGHNGSFGFYTHGSTTDYVAIKSLYTDNNNSGLMFQTKSSGADSERMRITSAGLVGIGSTTVYAKLDVAGDVMARGGTVGAQFDAMTLFHTPFANGNTVDAVTLRFMFNDTVWNPTVAGQVLVGKDATYQNGPTRSGFLAFHTRRADTLSEKMRITSFGNVLIGTTTRSSNAASTIVVQGSGTNGSGIQFSNVNVAGAAINTGSSNSLVFSSYTGAVGSETYTERARLTSDGNFLVGLTSSTDTSAGGGQFSGPLMTSGALNTSQTNRGVLQYSSNEASLRSYGASAGTGYLTFRTGGGGGGGDTERMRITATGSVGIGSTIPASVLDVSGTTTTRGLRSQNINLGQEHQIELNGTNGAFNAGLMFGATNTNNRAIFKFQVDTGVMQYLTSADATNYVERVRITQAGLVGIGTNAPTKPLDVAVGDTIRVYGSNPGHIGINIQNTGTNGRNFRIATYADGTAANTSFRIRDDNVGADRLAINTDGYVGIGTMLPAAPMHVMGIAGGINSIFDSPTAADTRNEYRNNGTRAGYVGWDGNSVVMSADSTRYLGFNTNSAERMRITSAGLVGIGTTSPISQVDTYLGSVSNNTTNVGYNVGADAAGNIGYAGYTLSLANSTGNATGFIRLARTAATAYLGMEIQSQSRDGIRFLTGVSSPVEVAKIDQNGKVGIGTSVYFDQLQVYGDLGVHGVSGSSRQINIRSTHSTAGGNIVGYHRYNVFAWGTNLTTWLGRNAGGSGPQNAVMHSVLDDPSGYPNQNTLTSLNTDTLNTSAVLYVGHGSNVAANTLPSLYLERGAVLAASSGNVRINSNAISTSTTTGAFIVTGGVGIGGNINVGGTVNTFSGRVGIGTTIPGFLLDVSAAGVNTIRAMSTGGDTAMAGFRFAGASTNADWTWGTNASNVGGAAATAFLLNNTLSTIPFVVTSAGSVGIGTTIPGYKLDIASAGQGIANIRLLGPSVDNNWAGGIRFYSYDSTTVRNEILNNTSGMQFYTANAERMRIDAVGNVGIGTTPASRFAIAESNTDNVTLGIWNTSVYGSGNQISRISLGKVENLTYQPMAHVLAGPEGIANSANGYLALHTRAAGTTAERVRVTSGGSVGIGSTIPAAKLDVAGDIAATGDIRSTGAGANQANFQASNSGSTSYLHMIRPGYQGWYVTSPVASADLYISEGSGTLADTRLYFKTGGNIGIGTTNPGAKLDVYGNQNSDFAAASFRNVSNGASSTTSIRLGNDVTATGGYISLNGNSNSINPNALRISNQISGNSSTIIFATNADVERMRIDATGNVGIGTTSAPARLTVETTNDNLGIQVGAIASTGSQVHIGIGVLTVGRPFIGTNTNSNELDFGTRSNVPIKFFTNSTEKMRILSNGNVGIGNNAPEYQLHVSSGNNNASAIAVGTSAEWGEPVWRFVSATTNYTSIGFSDGTSSGSTNVLEALNILRTGNVAVGTNSNIRAKLQSSGATATATPTLGNPSGGALLLTNTDTNYGWLSGVSSSGTVWAQAQRVDGTATAYDMLLQPSGGNVGIGTSSVTTGYRLQVRGGFAATTKSFVIDHPTKPNMKLRYGSLEGPENGVYVRGRTKTVVIDLPDHWTGLVDEDSITVSLTAIGRKQELYVKEIKDNKVYIGGTRNIDCFYTVFAERKDVDKLVVEFKDL